jgi:uncharacterized protein (TIGR00255 family)
MHMSPLKSMTGFATVQTEYNSNEASCEIRSLNSRYLEISLRLPRMLTDLENSIKEIIRQKISRGKIMYSLNFSSLNNENQNLKIQGDLIKFYKSLLEQIKKEAGIKSPLKLDHLLFFKDVISFEEDSSVDEELANFVYKLTDAALDRLNEMQIQEGQYLRTDLEGRIGKISTLNNEIKELSKSNPSAEFSRLYSRILGLIGEEKVDRNRLELEMALIADKVDITEEVVRLQSHIQLFKNNLAEGSPVGKKLNFILQEMNREINTMSNKSTLVEISHRVVQLKEEIEKIREQVQNIE